MIGEQLNRASDSEEYVRSHLFCCFNNAIRGNVYYSTSKPARVLAEVPAGRDKADLVVTTVSGRDEFTLLLVECKRRILEKQGRRFGEASSQAARYAAELRCPYFAVYDGRIFLLFRNENPFLTDVSETSLEGAILGDFCFKLLVNLLEQKYLVGALMKALGRTALPGIGDKQLFEKRVLPVVVRYILKSNSERAGLKMERMEFEARCSNLLSLWLDLLRSK